MKTIKDLLRALEPTGNHDYLIVFYTFLRMINRICHIMVFDIGPRILLNKKPMRVFNQWGHGNNFGPD